MTNDYFSDYRPPTPEQLVDLEEAEKLYTQLESFIRLTLPAGVIRQQALFRLRESETWTKEGIKGLTLDEPAPRLPKTKSGSYILE